MYVLGQYKFKCFVVHAQLSFVSHSIDIYTVSIKNIRIIHGFSTNQIAKILHFNDSVICNMQQAISIHEIVDIQTWYSHISSHQVKLHLRCNHKHVLYIFIREFVLFYLLEMRGINPGTIPSLSLSLCPLFFKKFLFFTK